MRKLIEYTMVFEVYLACGIACLGMLGYRAFVSAAIAGNYIVVLALFLLTLAAAGRVRIQHFLPLVGIVVLSLLGILVTARTLSFSYLKKWIMFLCTMMLYYCTGELRTTKRIKDAIFRGCMLLSAFYMGMYMTGRHYLYAGGITLNLGNPNYTGMCLLSTMVCIFPFLQKEKTRSQKILITAVLVFLAYLLLLTRARGCIVSLAVYLCLCFFYRARYQKWLTLVFLVLPVAFAVAYMELVSHSDVLEFFSFLSSEGKELTSRVRIWDRAFEILRENLLLGNYYLATDGSGLGQLHNLGLDTLAAYGAPVFVLVTYFMYQRLRSIGVCITHRYQMVSLYGFYALLLSGSFEAGLFSNSQGMYVLSAGLLMMADDRTEGV